MQQYVYVHEASKSNCTKEIKYRIAIDGLNMV